MEEPPKNSQDNMEVKYYTNYPKIAVWYLSKGSVKPSFSMKILSIIGKLISALSALSII